MERLKLIHLDSAAVCKNPKIFTCWGKKRPFSQRDMNDLARKECRREMARRWLSNCNISPPFRRTHLVSKRHYNAQFGSIRRENTWQSVVRLREPRETCSLMELTRSLATVGNCSAAPFDFLKWCISLSLPNAIHSAKPSYSFSFRPCNVSAGNKRMSRRGKTSGL